MSCIGQYEERSSRRQGRIDAGWGIADMKEIVSFGLLSSDLKEPLGRFNYIEMSKDELAGWKDRKEFIDLVSQFIRDEKWKSSSDFNYLDDLIKTVLQTYKKGE